MKKYYKITTILIMILTLLSSFYAVNADTLTPSGFTGDSTSDGAKEVATFGGQIIGIVRFFGTWASVAVLIILGIKYMMGSIEEKAEYKKSMLPYVIGAVLVFAATNIVSVIYGMKL